MKVHSMFPIPIAQVNLNRKLTEEEYNCIMSQELRPNMMNAVSNNFTVLDRPELKQIKAFSQYYLEEFWKNVYAPKENIEINLTLSWINYLKKGDWNNEHNHSNSVVSGVFYVQTQPEDGIMFHRTVEYKALTWATTHDTPWNSDRLIFNAIEGDLLLFPSSLTHVVAPVLHEGVRVSLAFNSWLSGEIGEDLSALKL